MAILRHDQAKTSKLALEWGCPHCSSKKTKTRYVEYDEDATPMRLFICGDCGTRWASEEHPISVEAFFSRAVARRRRRFYQYRTQTKLCFKCNHRYRRGYYGSHCRKPQHIAALKRSENLERDRESSRLWATGNSHCQWCGLHYESGKFAIHVRSPVHVGKLKSPHTEEQRAVWRAKARRERERANR
jgi:hypothetical protein